MSNPEPFMTDVSVVGMRFRGEQAKDYAQNRATKGEIFLLEREPENEYDPSAVKVMCVPEDDTISPWHIAYVNKDDAVFLAYHMDAGDEFLFEFNEFAALGRSHQMIGDIIPKPEEA